MYQHLLVPMDGSPLSMATVEHAVALAGRLGARITFFHARADFGATGDGALLHAVAPASFEQGAAGNAKALLAKAEAAARAAHVTCASLAAVSDHPHEAILASASACQCDLIVMASHGRRGLKGVLIGSVTQKVLQHATVPVLVAAVESNLPQSDAQQALAIIKDEHRSLAAVIHGLQHAVAQLLDCAVPPDFALLRAMLYYIEQFPERLHHPKEEAFLFRLLRKRTDAFDTALTDLEQQHHEGSALFAALRAALQAFESGEPGGAARFSAALEVFAQAEWHHMSSEETVILPAAAAHLTEGDWREIAHAFVQNGDPRFDQQAGEAFEQLFTRILNAAPAAQLGSTAS